MRNPDVIIVGAGASGLACAIEAARGGAKVLVLEKQERGAKKILVTGNGRCNFTNEYQADACYRGTHPEFAHILLDRFSAQEIVRWMAELGVRPVNRDGYYYPASNQAQSVADCLLFACKGLGVEIAANAEVLSIVRTKNGWSVRTKSESYRAAALVLACGTEAGMKAGGNGWELLESLSLPLIDRAPALVKLFSKVPYLETWKGVRLEGRVTLMIDGREAASDAGELQLTEDGISGIPVFQVSRFAARALAKGQRTEAVIDALCEMSEEEIREELKNRFLRYPELRAQDALSGLIHKKLIPLYTRQTGMRDRALCFEVSADQIALLASRLKNLTVPVSGCGSTSGAQVLSGGLDTSAVDPASMMVKSLPGLYVTGELLDIDGICGGYNLHFAWMTGITAGRAAAAMNR